MSGNEDVAPEPVPLWQRIVGFGAGTLLLMPDLAIAGGLNGITKELAKNVGIVIGTEVLLGLFIGFTNPFVLVGGIVAAILGGNFTSDAAMKKIKNMLGEAIVSKVSENADEGATKTSETIASILMDIANDISSAVDNEISQTEQLVTGIIDEMQRGQANIDARKQVINSCEAKIKALSTELDAFTFELIEQK